MGQASPLGLVWPGTGTLNNDPTKIMSNRGMVVCQMKKLMLIKEARKPMEGHAPYFLSQHSTRCLNRLFI